jgi:hypothetical protein
MCNNTCLLRFHHTRRIVHKILGRLSFAKLKNPQRPTYKTIPEAVAPFFFFTVVSVTVADLRGSSSPRINSLQEFRPIGGSDNFPGDNRSSPNKPIPYTSLLVPLLWEIKSVVLGLVATSVGVAQGSEIKAAVHRVYLGNDYLGNDYGQQHFDPPYWSYLRGDFPHSQSEHWLYKNHRHIFIDIELRNPDLR